MEEGSGMCTGRGLSGVKLCPLKRGASEEEHDFMGKEDE
jgi:hypothetical protein